MHREQVKGAAVTNIESGEKLVFKSGATLEVESGATVTMGDGIQAPGDIAVASAKVIVGNASNVGAAVDMSGDVTISNAGVTAIGASKVTGAMWAQGSGVAAILAAGLGGSVSVTKTSAATATVVAAHATKDRAVIVVVTVDETYAIGTGTLPTVKIGEDSTVEKCMAATVLDTEAAGTVLVFAFTNLATKKIIVTTTAAVGNATGGCSVAVIAIPTT